MPPPTPLPPLALEPPRPPTASLPAKTESRTEAAETFLKPGLVESSRPPPAPRPPRKPLPPLPPRAALSATRLSISDRVPPLF